MSNNDIKVNQHSGQNPYVDGTWIPYKEPYVEVGHDHLLCLCVGTLEPNGAWFVKVHHPSCPMAWSYRRAEFIDVE